jgi:hypothetical protein
MKRCVLSMAAGVIALTGLGLFATSASAHPAPCGPVRSYCAPVYRGHHWDHRVYHHSVWVKHRKPC